MKVHVVNYWEGSEVVLTGVFAGLPTGEEIRALWLASRRSYWDAEFRVEASREGWNVDVFQDGEEDCYFYATVSLEEVHPTASGPIAVVT